MSTVIPTISNVADTLHQYAEEYSLELYPAKHREHLGISVIGRKCAREIWYGFRWVKLQQFPGRMRRLFQRGHDEEKKFYAFLLWAGISFREIDPETDKEFKISKLNGHYGGTPDNIGLIRWLDNLQIAIEYKTHNKKSFDKLKADKLKIAKPEHWAQMCGYGKEFKIKYGLYCAVNKDDDDLYFEFLELDWNFAIELEKKAADIIYAKTPPLRISDNPSYFDCKYCDKVDICHNGAKVEINCRSCKFSEPADNAKWFCNRFKNEIPNEFVKLGCEYHLSVNT